MFGFIKNILTELTFVLRLTPLLLTPCELCITMPVDPQQHRMCTRLCVMCHARVRSPSDNSCRSHSCMAVPVVLLITMLTLPMIVTVVVTEIEHASHSHTMQFWQPDHANNVRTWCPLTDCFDERPIGSYWVLFLLMSGDVLPNPGPTRHWKYPRTTCQKPVKKTSGHTVRPVRCVDALAMYSRCHMDHERRVKPTISHRRKLVLLSMPVANFQ